MNALDCCNYKKYRLIRGYQGKGRTKSSFLPQLITHYGRPLDMIIGLIPSLCSSPVSPPQLSSHDKTLFFYPWETIINNNNNTRLLTHILFSERTRNRTRSTDPLLIIQSKLLGGNIATESPSQRKELNRLIKNEKNYRICLFHCIFSTAGTPPIYSCLHNMQISVIYTQ